MSGETLDEWRASKLAEAQEDRDRYLEALPWLGKRVRRKGTASLGLVIVIRFGQDFMLEVSWDDEPHTRYERAIDLEEINE